MGKFKSFSHSVFVWFLVHTGDCCLAVWNSTLPHVFQSGNTQKIITGRKCTLPTDNFEEINKTLKTINQPFPKRKSVVHKLKTEKTKPTEKQKLLTGWLQSGLSLVKNLKTQAIIIRAIIAATVFDP